MQTTNYARPQGPVAPDLPGYVVSSPKVNRYDPLTGTYNLKGSNTRKLRRDLARISAKTGVVDWTVIGDSKSGGLNAGGHVAWPLALRRTLSGMGYPTSGGINYAASPGAEPNWNDARWTFTGGTARINNACIQLTTAASTATFRSDVAGDSVDIWYFGTSAPFTYSIDGAAPVTFTPNGTYDLFKLTIGNLPKTFHTVVIGTPAPNVYIIGIDVYLAAYGLKVHNYSQAGQSSVFAVDVSDRVSNGTVIRTTVPNNSVTFIALGTNDLFQGRTPTQMHDSLATTIVAEKARASAPDVVLLVETSAASPDTSWEPYIERLYMLADEYDVPVLDLYALTGPNNTLVAAGTLGSDGIHETALGHQLVASHVANAFVQTGTPQPTAPKALPVNGGDLGLDGNNVLSWHDGNRVRRAKDGFDSKSGVYVPSQSALTKFRAQYAKAVAGTDLCEIAAVGPSTVAGVGSTVASSFPAQMVASLAVRGIPAQRGWANGTYATTGFPTTFIDPRWSFGSGWQRFSSTYPYVPAAYTGTAGSVATFTSPEAGTVVEWLVVAASGAYTYSIDGAAPVTVPAQGSSGYATPVTVTGLANKPHTLVITVTSGTVYLMKARVRNATGVLVSNYGWSGATLQDWDKTDVNTSTQGFSLPFAAHQGSLPHLFIFDALTWVNSYNGLPASWQPSDTRTYIDRIIGQLRANGADVVLMLSSQPSTATGAFPAIPDALYQAHRNVIYQAAEDNNCVLIDSAIRTGSWAAANANGLRADQYHSTPSGYSDMASALIEGLGLLDVAATTVTAPPAVPDTYGEIGMDNGRLAFYDGNRSVPLGPRTPQFAELIVMGHSYGQLTTTGVSRLGHRWSTKLASMIGAREWNAAINGSKLAWPDNGAPSGGWNTMFHAFLRNRSIARATGAGYPAENSVAAFYWGANDWPRLGFAKLSTTTVFGNVLRATIARWRASRHFASNDASVVYATPANWTSDTSIQYGANPAGSGEIVKKSTVAAPGNITITTPSDVEAGCYITVYFGVDPTSTAGSAAITWGGVSQGSISTGGTALIDNSADTSGAAPVTTARHAITCKRIGPVVTPGAQTIVITMTGAAPATGHAFAGYDIEEADPPPLLLLNSPKITTAVGYGLWRLGPAYQGTTNQFPATDTGANSADTLWDQGNAVIASVAAEFDARVMVIDVDAALAKNSIYWPAGDAHPNDRGNTVIAGLCYNALERFNQGLTQAQLAEVNVDTVGGDSLGDQFATNPGKFGGTNVFGRSRSAKLYYPVVVGETPTSKTLVASTQQSLTGQYFISVTDFAEFRLRAHVTTALANARLFPEGQPVFGYNGLDGLAITHPTEYGGLMLDATGMWVTAWLPLFPQYRRGEWQLRFSLYGTTAGTVAFTNAGIEFR